MLRHNLLIGRKLAIRQEDSLLFRQIRIQRRSQRRRTALLQSLSFRSSETELGMQSYGRLDDLWSEMTLERRSDT
jgi:hypothetical protein